MAPIRQMTEDEKKLFTIFQKAIEAEQCAQEMYREAISLCGDPQMREILEGFYNDEARHEKEILAKYRKLKEEFGIE